MRDQILEAVLAALAEVFSLREDGGAGIEPSPQTRLFGREATLESMELVNLLLDVETRLEDILEEPISLMDERAMSQTKSPFRSVETLVDYIVASANE